MRNFKAWIAKILSPEQAQLKSDISLEQVMEALNDATVRRLWIQAMLDKVQMMNLELDNLLSKEDRQRTWEMFAIERRTLLRSITMILDARDHLESERDAQERQNRVFESYKGAAATLPLDNRANNLARD